jgi:hypothetical protein
MLVDYIPANILFKIIIESSFYRKIFRPIITLFPTVSEWIWRAKGEIVKKMKQESTGWREWMQQPSSKSEGGVSKR